MWKLSILSGRLAFGASLLRTEDIAAGMGRCPMCGVDTDAWDSVQHLSECTGTIHASVGARLSMLHMLHRYRLLASMPDEPFERQAM